MKKLIIFVMLLFVTTLTFYSMKFNIVYADNSTTIQEELSENVEEQLNDLDLTGLEGLLAKLTSGEIQIFGNHSFIEKVKSLINGEFNTDGKSVFVIIVNLFFESLLTYLPLIALIIAIAVMYSMVSSSRPNLKKNSIGDLIHFVCYGTIVIVIVSIIVQIISMTTATLTSIKNQMEVAFPVLLTLLTAVGGTASVSVYQPAMGLLSGVIFKLFTHILLPIYVFSLIFTIMSNLTNSIKFSKFADFFNSVFKWIIGIVFTTFMAFVSIQGITAGSIDGISIKTAKYAIKNSVPVVGGYLSDGFNLILASSMLIKNAIGASGLLLMIASIIVPILNIVVFMLCLKLASAILEPICDSKICSFISSVAKSMNMLIGLLASISFAYMILVGLVMCSANIV